jgi:SH3-like domain-containing protein
MPAVLIEGGSIVNRDEELVVSTPAFRSLIASAVVESVGAFCASASAAPPAKLASTDSTPVYRVTGVSGNDVLNIRASPDANSAIVNTIPPDGKGVRITGDCSENWCPVDYRHASGWVNRRFLARE